MNGFVYGHPITIDINLLFSVCVRLLLHIRFHTFHPGSSEEKKKKVDRKKEMFGLLLSSLVANTLIQAEKRETFANSKKSAGKAKKTTANIVSSCKAKSS